MCHTVPICYSSGNIQQVDTPWSSSSSVCVNIRLQVYITISQGNNITNLCTFYFCTTVFNNMSVYTAVVCVSSSERGDFAEASVFY